MITHRRGDICTLTGETRTGASPFTASYTVDGAGNRTSRTSGGTTTQFHYAGSAVLRPGRGTARRARTGGTASRRGGEYPLYDGSGSERTVTNSSQTVTGSINFEAFGQPASSSGSNSSPYMFAGNWGYRTDGDAGLRRRQDVVGK